MYEMHNILTIHFYNDERVICITSQSQIAGIFHQLHYGGAIYGSRWK